MKNQEIIAKAAVQIGLLTAAEAEKRLMNGEDIPLHTLQGWRLRGNYKVKDDAEPIEVKLHSKQTDVIVKLRTKQHGLSKLRDEKTRLEVQLELLQKKDNKTKA